MKSNEKNFESDKARFNENEKNMKMNLDVLRSKEQNTVEEVIFLWVEEELIFF